MATLYKLSAVVSERDLSEDGFDFANAADEQIAKHIIDIYFCGPIGWADGDPDTRSENPAGTHLDDRGQHYVLVTLPWACFELWHRAA